MLLLQKPDTLDSQTINPLRQINPDRNSHGDSLLWTQLKAGDDKAFEQIYCLYVDDLFRFGKSLTDRHDVIRDCIQDVFIDLWHYKNRVNETVHVKYYLFRILSNKISRHFGKEIKSKQQEHLAFFSKDFFQASSEEDLIQSQEISISHQRLKQALSKLPLRQREVIHYVFFEKLGYDQVAAIMQINVRSAYTLTWKAVQTLKHAFISFVAVISF